MVTIKNSFKDVADWLELQRSRFKTEEIAEFEKAIALAEEYYHGQVFYPTSADMLIHSLKCANTVAELHLYADAVTATILYALPKFCESWRNKLTNFSPVVVSLVGEIDRVTQIRKSGDLELAIDEHEKKEQIEVIRKMLLAMATDIRVILIMLVGRGELMLNLKTCKDPQLQQKIALETMEIFAPLANRLGVWQIKWQLEDLSFRYIHPEQYKKISQLLDESREARLQYIEDIKSYLTNQMIESGIHDFQVSGRAKHIYSIWKKMHKKNYGFEKLYDLRALRVIVPEIKDCYTVLGILHTKYSPVAGEFDDYISNPKPNNYQSLHTCVVGPEDRVIEIQIRTYAMHDHAEYGVAAHWRYKEGGENNPKFEEKIAWIRQLLDWRDESAIQKDITEVFKNEIFSDSIYVMTPNGRVITLPAGSTPIDFAYAVHSSIGHRCRGAKIDGHIVTLATPLSNGQRVEIMTVKAGGPSINWLHEGWVKSSKAISHIRRYIRNQNNEDFFEAGKEIFERELGKFPSSSRPKIEEIVSKLNHTNEKDLQVALGKGDILPQALHDVIEKLIEPVKAERQELTYSDLEKQLEERKNKLPQVNDKSSGTILVDGVSGIMTNFAKCCKPIPGDEIIGFISKGSGVAIHRSNCAEIRRQAKVTPHKIIHVEWADSAKNSSYSTDVEIIANDRHGLLRDLTDVFAMEKINIIGLRTITRNNKAIATFTIQVPGKEFNFTWFMSKLFNVNGVLEVLRR